MEAKMPKLSNDDPVLKTLNQITKILDPFDRTQQIRILASVCIALGHLDHAQGFLNALREDARENEA